MTAPKEILEALHKMVGEQLLEQISAGDAGASVFAQAIKFLKDNNIDAANSPTLDKLMGSLEATLPFTDPNDPTTHSH